mgnify:CR=1 FL=1
MKKQLVLFLALALCLGLTACGDTESDDTQSGYETVMDMELLDGMWSIDGTSRLYFDSEEGFYATAPAGVSAGAENLNCPRRAAGR